MKHTKEPWIVGQSGNSIVTNTQIIGQCNGMAIGEANAERIVACVNAMEDVEHPEKWREIQAERIKENVELKVELDYLRGEHKSDVLKISELEDERDELKAERDLMLAALRAIEAMHPKDHNGRENCFALARKIVLETLLAIENDGR